LRDGGFKHFFARIICYNSHSLVTAISERLHFQKPEFCSRVKRKPLGNAEIIDARRSQVMMSEHHIPVCLSACQSVSQSASQPASQPASQSVSQSISPSNSHENPSRHQHSQTQQSVSKIALVICFFTKIK